MTVNIVDFAKTRIAAALDEVERLRHSEFPDEHSRQAMSYLADIFRKRNNILAQFTDATMPDTARNESSVSLELLFTFVPIIGFILRSTNVRNAFEANAPLLRLAKQLIGSDTKLVLSSEWEFSPITYVSDARLPGFVLIGLPATESHNPLILPLTGHELGHSVWEVKGIGQSFEDKTRQGIVDEIKLKRWNDYKSLFPDYTQEDIEADWVCISTWQPAHGYSILQAKEVFCDFMGLRLFAESYLHAFAYLLAPGIKDQRRLNYPNIKDRISHLIWAAKELNVAVPKDYESFFIADTESTEPTTAFLISIADAVVSSIETDLLNEVKTLADALSIPKRNPERVNDITKHFSNWVVPTTSSDTLVDVVNAGWICNLNKELWAQANGLQIKSEDRVRILHDLILKSLEVAEIKIRLKELEEAP